MDFRVVLLNLLELPCPRIVAEKYHWRSHRDAICVREDEFRARVEFDAEGSDLDDARTEVTERQFDRCAGVFERRQEDIACGTAGIFFGWRESTGLRPPLDLQPEFVVGYYRYRLRAADLHPRGVQCATAIADG